MVFVLIAHRPLHNGVDILERSGESVARGKAVIEVNNGKALRGEKGAVEPVLLGTAVNVAAAVIVYYSREGRACALWI